MIKPLYATKSRLKNEIKRVGVDPYAEYLVNKGLPFNIKIKNLKPCQANIIKQEALAVGIDAAVARDVVSCLRDISDVCLFTHIHGLTKFIKKLKLQPFGLKNIALEIEELLFADKTKELKLRNIRMPLNRPKLMAILNTTPDSFSDGGMHTTREAILGRLTEFKEKKVDIVDIGGESTRPYSKRVSAEEEWNRIAFAVEKALELGLVVSVDTYKSEVAAEALKLGVHLINDISGMCFDSDMAEVVANYSAGVCLMHIKGVPETMQDNPCYEDVVEEIYFYLDNLINKAVSAGISRESIIVDPGFGFGKKLEHNISLLKCFWEFSGLKMPILVGISRKGFVGKLLGNKDNYRVLGSKLLEMLTLLQGASIVRTHDIDETIALIELTNNFICDD